MQGVLLDGALEGLRRICEASRACDLVIVAIHWGEEKEGKANNTQIKLGHAAVDAGAGHILNVSFTGVRGEVMLHALEGEGVLVSTGSACSSKKRHLSPVLMAMGIDADRAEAAIRFSLSPLTDESEIDWAIAAAQKSYAMLKAFIRR